jgi:hypothetical protein
VNFNIGDHGKSVGGSIDKSRFDESVGQLWAHHPHQMVTKVITNRVDSVNVS